MADADWERELDPPRAFLATCIAIMPSGVFIIQPTELTARCLCNTEGLGAYVWFTYVEKGFQISRGGL